MISQLQTLGGALFVASLVPGAFFGTAQAADTKPNIVFILMDKLGYGELGCYGGGILRGAPTARIDELATEGMRLLNFNLALPRVFNLLTDLKEERDVAAFNSWVADPMFKILAAFQASLKKYPPIKVGTPHPYTPPNP